MPELYAILDTAWLGDEQLEPAAKALLSAGVSMLQLRAKERSEAGVREALERVLPLCRQAGCPFILNDRVELAAEYEDCGLHVGQDDLGAEEARALIGPGRRLGLSTHDLEQARAAIALAGVIDYFAVGPVYPTAIKPEYGCVGLELVREVAALKPSLPYYGIGGIRQDNARAVVEAGATGVVIIRDLLQAEDIEAKARAVVNRLG